MEHRIYFADVFFKASRPLKSLPPWHGARWHAWLRYGLKHKMEMDKAIMAILPFGRGQKHIQPNAITGLRLILTDYGLDNFTTLMEGLISAPIQGIFCPANLSLEFAADAIGGQPLYPEFTPPKAFSFQIIEKEARALLEMEKITLKFISPLRLPMPPGKKTRHAEIGRYCDATFMGTREGVEHLLNRVRGGSLCPAPPVLESQLAWEDLRYSRDRKIALGGLTGEIILGMPPEQTTATALALGQYQGAGKNARFGLGFWRIMELDGIRAIYLPR